MISRPHVLASLLGGALGLLLLSPGCGDFTVEMELPLSLYESYPASGAEVPLESLRELRLVFSEPLSPDFAAEPSALDALLLERSEGGAEWQRLGLGGVEVSAEPPGLLLRPETAALEALGEGAELRLTVRAGLRSLSGARLPRDRVLFFRRRG